ncbi:MAG: Cell shape determining protein, MreB/Mrl family [Parcubacteria group bacterium GW2011_GWA1_48_11b]|nr:MAG: Cell shape determining protein, MreB/Mrl family [Parcubacteria group bacterium GW2011_GWA1_48_11b]
MGGVIASRSLRIAGDKLNEDILRYMREEKKLLIGEATAEQLKCSLGSAFALDEELEGRVRGRDLISGLPKEMTVSSEELREAMERSVGAIVLAVKNTIEETPPELTADLFNRHIFLAGGGALLRGLDKHIAEETKLFVKIVDDPLAAVARGCGFVLENVGQLKSVLVSTQKDEFI